MNPKARFPEWLALSGILCLSLFLNIWNNNFPPGFHPDELIKVKFISHFKPDFHHPVMMLQAVRLVNNFLHLTDPKDILFLGRTLSGILGALTVLFVYLLARGILGRKWALLAALATAVSPIIVVHAHYLKEDIVFLCFSMLCLQRFLKFIEEQHWKNTVWFAAALGLMFSSQYKGLIFLVLYFLAPAIVTIKDKRRYYLNLLGALGLSACVFLIFNYAIFSDWKFTTGGMQYQWQYVVKGGHTLKITPWESFFTFYFLHTLAPGMTWPVLILSCMGIMAVLVKREKFLWQDRVLLSYAALYYFVVELVPAKAFPDIMRYIIPIVPVLIYFSCRFLQFLENNFNFGKTKIIFILITAVFIAVPLRDSLMLDYYLTKDTRLKAQEWIARAKAKVMFESYVYPFEIVGKLTDVDLAAWQAQGFEYLVASSFQYGRYLYGEKLKNQGQIVYDTAERYHKLFEFPSREILPDYKTFAFSNPVIRIIDIRHKGEYFE